jgi:hypothetical protein
MFIKIRLFSLVAVFRLRCNQWFGSDFLAAEKKVMRTLYGWAQVYCEIIITNLLLNGLMDKTSKSKTTFSAKRSIGTAIS